VTVHLGTSVVETLIRMRPPDQHKKPEQIADLFGPFGSANLLSQRVRFMLRRAQWRRAAGESR
jgi:hypothetical protein